MGYHHVIPHRHFAVMMLEYKVFLHPGEKPEKHTDHPRDKKKKKL